MMGKIMTNKKTNAVNDTFAKLAEDRQIEFICNLMSGSDTATLENICDQVDPANRQQFALSIAVNQSLERPTTNSDFKAQVLAMREEFLKNKEGAKVMKEQDAAAIRSKRSEVLEVLATSSEHTL